MGELECVTVDKTHPPSYPVMFPPSVPNCMNEDDAQLFHGMQIVKLTRRSHWLETFCFCNMAIRFQLSSDSTVLQIDEQGSFRTRNCRSDKARIHARVFNSLHQPVLDFQRNIQQDQDSMLVFAANGTIHLGTVRRDRSTSKPQFQVLDAAGRVLAEIRAVKNEDSRDVDYQIVSLTYSNAEVEIGTITKHWNGRLAEVTVNYDDFTIRLAGYLDASLKATILGAVYFMNLTLYQKTIRKALKILLTLCIMIALTLTVMMLLHCFDDNFRCKRSSPESGRVWPFVRAGIIFLACLTALYKMYSRPTHT